METLFFAGSLSERLRNGFTFFFKLLPSLLNKEGRIDQIDFDSSDPFARPLLPKNPPRH